VKLSRIVFLLAMILQIGPVFAQRVITIKMASVVPENTPWGQFINRVAAEWRRITNGEVNVIIYHNGTAGKEEAVVRNLRVNQLQAGVLSTFGLTEIIPEILTLSCPLFIRNDEELDLVLNDIKAELEEKLSDKGFFTIAWSRVGWIKIFSKAPVFVPFDLKSQKLGTNLEYDKLNQVFKTMGFQLVPVAQDDLLIALNSPMVDAVYQSPIGVGSMQLFGLAKNMASINVAPFMGAIVMNKRAWNSIPDKYKPRMIEAARKEEIELDRVVRKFEEDMIKTMGNYGLTVNHLSQEQEQLWYDDAERAMPSLMGTFPDRNLFMRIQNILNNERTRQRR
jgi:TRAP-type C4-dicarboxylate transport system substrate-binding protein